MPARVEESGPGCHCWFSGEQQPREAPLTHSGDLSSSLLSPPLLEPTGSGLFRLCTQPGPLSLLTFPPITANQQSLNPTSPNPGVPRWGCGPGWAAGFRRETPGEAWRAGEAVWSPAGSPKTGQVQAPAAGIPAQFPFSVLILGGGGRGRRSWKRLTCQRTEFPELSERGGACSRPVTGKEVKQ